MANFTKGRDRSTFKHGRSKTWRIWCNMKSRCLNPNVKSYADYGGRGITVCQKWLTFDGFYEDMGEVPSELLLERIDNNGPYSLDNCRWATRTEQNKNSRHNVVLEINGVRKLQTEWADEYGLCRETVCMRRKAGCVGEDLIRPVGTARAPTSGIAR